MTRERLYIIHGTGPDRVGLVGSITTPIANAGGNIVDLRQDVLHGLFTLFMVVDLSPTALRTTELTALVRHIAEDTNLELGVDNFAPVPRSPQKHSLLMILIGRDKPGITASLAETLGKYRINIEMAQTVAREGVFLVELLTDVGNCTLPLRNVQDSLSATMAAHGMSTMFQTENVFNKQKRLVVFAAELSLLGPAAQSELLLQTRISTQELANLYQSSDHASRLRIASAKLEGVPADALAQVAQALRPTPDTMELLQTLKTMGYATALASPSLSLLTSTLPLSLGLDDVLDIALKIDDDSRLCTGEAALEDLAHLDRVRSANELSRRHGVRAEDVTIIEAKGAPANPGIRFEPRLSDILELFNSRGLSRDNILGLLGALGTPYAAG